MVGMQQPRVVVRCSTCRRLLREAYRDPGGGWTMPLGRLADGLSVERVLAARVVDGHDRSSDTPIDARLRETVATMESVLSSRQTTNGATDRMIFKCIGKRHTLSRPVTAATLWRLVDEASRRTPAEVLL